MVALFMFYMLAYRPAILQMDKDMRRTRSMLLMFPDEVKSVRHVTGYNSDARVSSHLGILIGTRPPFSVWLKFKLYFV